MALGTALTAMRPVEHSAAVLKPPLSLDRAEAPENHTPGVRGVGPGCGDGDWAPTRLDFRRAWGSSSSWPVVSYGQTPGGPIPTSSDTRPRASSRRGSGRGIRWGG